MGQAKRRATEIAVIKAACAVDGVSKRDYQLDQRRSQFDRDFPLFVDVFGHEPAFDNPIQLALAGRMASARQAAELVMQGRYGGRWLRQSPRKSREQRQGDRDDNGGKGYEVEAIESEAREAQPSGA